MKPYEVEIFDRNFNFRANALIDVFSWKEDVLTIAKNSILVRKDKIIPRDRATSGTAGDGTVACSDYIRIYDPNYNHYYQGIVIEITEEDDFFYKIVSCSLYKLFDHEVAILVDDIKHTTIERYIKSLISQEFIDNADTLQNITGLTLEQTASSTTGVFDYNETSDVYTVVNILKDLIYPAFQNYLIFTEIVLDISAETVTVTIGKNLVNLGVIETNLPNVLEENVTIRNTTDEINKATLYDMVDYSLTPYTYYLHPSNYTYNQTNNSDRLFPVVNKVDYFDSDALVEEAYFKTANQYVQATEKYISINRTLSDLEYNELTTAITHLWDYFKYLETTSIYTGEVRDWFIHYIMNYWYGIAGNDLQPVSSYDDLLEEGSGHYFFLAPQITGDPAWTAYKPIQTVSGMSIDGYSNYAPTPATTGGYSFNLSGSIYDGTNTHASLYRLVIYRLYIIFPNDDQVASYTLNTTVYSPISTSMVNTALSNYKASDDFKADFAAYKTANFQTILNGYVKKIFDNSKYKNLIEMTIKADDSMIKPLTRRISGTAQIIYKGKTYNSILTGREFKNGLVKLIFGMIRLNLTQILNMKGV